MISLYSLCKSALSHLARYQIRVGLRSSIPYSYNKYLDYQYYCHYHHFIFQSSYYFRNIILILFVILIYYYICNYYYLNIILCILFYILVYYRHNVTSLLICAYPVSLYIPACWVDSRPWDECIRCGFDL